MRTIFESVRHSTFVDSAEHFRRIADASRQRFPSVLFERLRPDLRHRPFRRPGVPGRCDNGLGAGHAEDINLPALASGAPCLSRKISRSRNTTESVGTPAARLLTMGARESLEIRD